MGLLRAIAERWDRYWFGPCDAHPVAAFRILLGAYLLVYFLTLGPHVTLFFSNQGVYVPWLVPDYAPGPAGAWLIYLGSLAVFALLTAGWKPRLMAPLATASFFHHYLLYLAVQNSSYDRLTAIYLVVLCFADSGRVWAVGVPADPGAQVPIWPARIIRGQMILLYFGSGVWKWANPKWDWDSPILEATFIGMWASDLGRWIVALELPELFWNVSTRGVIAFELLLGVALFFRRTRWLGVIAGTLFHLLNTTVLLIPWFVVCLATYPFFIEPETQRRWVARVRALGRRDSGADP